MAYRPVNYGTIFPASGGLPLAKRAPQRQAYRLVELRRWADHLGIPLNPTPTTFPQSDELAALTVIAAEEAGADVGHSVPLWAERSGSKTAISPESRHGAEILDRHAASVRAGRAGRQRRHPGTPGHLYRAGPGGGCLRRTVICAGWGDLLGVRTVWTFGARSDREVRMRYRRCRGETGFRPPACSQSQAATRLRLAFDLIKTAAKLCKRRNPHAL